MDASKSNLLNFLSTGNELSIPIYQRKYSWSIRECNQLFKDILNAGSDDNQQSYFIGSVVFMVEDGYIAGPVKHITLIDGQQRITTITLILAAMCSYYKTRDINDYFNDIYLHYLVDAVSRKRKLFLTEYDDTTLDKIISTLDLDKNLIFNEDDSLSVRTNYEFFCNMINDDNITTLKQGLDKLLIINVALEYGKDNPQLIFESLNSTGLELGKSDLIRNYILMGLDKESQDKLYNNYWREIEDGFINEDNLFDDFIRNYLTIKLNRTIVKRDVYEEFKKYSHNFDNVEDLVYDVYQYAKYFFRIALGKENDPELKKVLDNLNNLGYDVTRPFLLGLYHDYDNKNEKPGLDKNDFIKIIEYVESYCLRRSICGIPSNSMNKTFANLHSKIDKNNYLESFIAEILLNDTYKRFPTNEELIDELKTKKIYNTRIINDILSKLENYDNKEIVDIESCTIEHIMPQNKNLSPQWKKDLGENYEEIQEKYLDTLGNLTLTVYNSEMSDKSFTEKKNMKGGFIDSKLTLNKDLSKLDTWNETEITKRTQKLSQQLVNIWKYPEITPEIKEMIKNRKTDKNKQEYTINDYEYLQEKTLTRKLYDTLNLRITSLDENIIQKMWKHYIAYKINRNFVELIPQKSAIKIALDIPIEEINDTKNICDDIKNKGSWSTGTTRTYLKKEEDIDYIMDLITQSYEYVE